MKRNVLKLALLAGTWVSCLASVSCTDDGGAQGTLKVQKKSQTGDSAKIERVRTEVLAKLIAEIDSMESLAPELKALLVAGLTAAPTGKTFEEQSRIFEEAVIGVLANQPAESKKLAPQLVSQVGATLLSVDEVSALSEDERNKLGQNLLAATVERLLGQGFSETEIAESVLSTYEGSSSAVLDRDIPGISREAVDIALAKIRSASEQSAPVPGSALEILENADAAITVRWGAAQDAVSPQASLQYKVIYGKQEEDVREAAQAAVKNEPVCLNGITQTEWEENRLQLQLAPLGSAAL